MGSFMQETALPWGCSIPSGHFEYTHTHRDFPGFSRGPLILGTLPSPSTPPSQETPSVIGPTAQVRDPLPAAMPPPCVPMIQGASKGPRGVGQGSGLGGFPSVGWSPGWPLYSLLPSNINSCYDWVLPAGAPQDSPCVIGPWGTDGHWQSWVPRVGAPVWWLD